MVQIYIIYICFYRLTFVERAKRMMMTTVLIVSTQMTITSTQMMMMMMVKEVKLLQKVILKKTVLPLDVDVGHQGLVGRDGVVVVVENRDVDVVVGSRDVEMEENLMATPTGSLLRRIVSISIPMPISNSSNIQDQVE